MGLLEEIEKVMEEHDLDYTFNQPEYEHFISQILSKITEVVEGARLKLNRGGILSDTEARYYNRGAGAQTNAILKAIKGEK